MLFVMTLLRVKNDLLKACLSDILFKPVLGGTAMDGILFRFCPLPPVQGDKLNWHWNLP